MQNIKTSSETQFSSGTLSQQIKSSSVVPSPSTEKVIQYPTSANDIRTRINGRGLRALREGQVISGGLRSLWEDE